jgi:hypothetical protein
MVCRIVSNEEISRSDVLTVACLLDQIKESLSLFHSQNQSF